MKSLALTPPLYHASALPLQGEAIRPHFATTGVAHQFEALFRNHPGYEELDDHSGNFVFATSELQQAYIYAFKNCGDRRSMSMVGGITLADGKTAQHALCCDKEHFLAAINHDCRIYRMPRVNSFRQVVSISGRKTNEWVSRRDVPLEQCREIPAPSIEEAMRRGVQFFFINDSLPEGVVNQRYNADVQQIGEQIAPLRKGDATHYEVEKSRLYMQALQRMVDEGLIEHYNATKGICPVDLETGRFREPPEKSFAAAELKRPQAVVTRLLAP